MCIIASVLNRPAGCILRGFLVGVFFLSACAVSLSARGAVWRPAFKSAADRVPVMELRYIVLPELPGEGLLQSVADLREVALKRGLSLEVTERKYKNRAIILQRSGRSRRLMEGGYLVIPERTRLIVRAASDEGLIHALYGLSSDLFGARWYWPGALGMELVGEVPRRFPAKIWRERPAFVHRCLHPSDREYALRNRLVGRYQFNHNLARVFDRELYQEEPEVFASIRGRRREPANSGKTDPQPDLTHPRAVEIAAEAALLHFREHPESPSFSLSINDNVLFDESEATRLAVEPLRYFRQRPDYTDLVFNFMNAVAERVFDRAGAWKTPSGHPRFLTALAYYWTEPSPTIRLHPRVMPVLTSDRAQWQDPQYRLEDMALIERWAVSGAERVATWDYYFGSPYPYPRQFNHWIGESIRHLHRCGVDVFFSQLPGAWGLDGGKAWLTSRLLWDPKEDPAVLLHEFYTGFFGPAAAPMRRFYELAEAHRDEHAGKADWIKFYLDEAGIELMTPELLESMQGCIEEAITLIDPESRYFQRVEVVREAFHLTRLYADYHDLRVALLSACLEGHGWDVPDLLARFESARSDFISYADALMESPYHKRLEAFLSMNQSDPVPLALMWMASAPSEEYAAISEVADAWRQGTRVPVLGNVYLQHREGEKQRHSFLGPDLPVVPWWYFDFRPYEHFRVEELTEYQGIRVSGADMCSVFAGVSVVEETGYVLEFDCAYRISPDNRTKLFLDWHDEDENLLARSLPLQLPRGASEKVRQLRIPAIAPKGAKLLKIRFLISRQAAVDFLELHRVRLDEVRLPSPPKE